MARPFHFKLAKILEYRRQVEDQAKLALSQARQTRAEHLARVERLRLDFQSCLRELSAHKQLTQADLWLWSSYRERLAQDMAQAEKHLTELDKLVETRRKELVAKALERKLLEKLRAKQAEKHEHDAQRKEQNEFDETATLRHGRASY